MSSDPHLDVVCRLDVLLTERHMTLTELSRRTGITMANLSLLKNNKVKAIRMSTLRALCEVLGVSPGEILVYGSAAEIRRT